MQERQHLIDIFLKINEQINLSAIRTPEQVYVKHIQDSLIINEIFTFDTTKTLADLGTGGGFPLLPLAISHPDLPCTGIDARRKKTLAVQSIAEQLGLNNVSTIRSRAEQMTTKYDYVTARAVGYADRILPRAHRITRHGGYIILYKLFTPEEEDDLFTLAHGLQLQTHLINPYKLPDDDTQRVIYIFSK